MEKKYPINDQVSYGKDTLWGKCKTYKLRPLDGVLYCFGSTGKFLTLYDSAPGAANMVGTFVWISPKLSEETSTKLFLLLKKYQVACGFSINDALRYRRVLVVDPKSDFSEADWNRLTGAGITVEPVHGSEEALASNLADLLS